MNILIHTWFSVCVCVCVFMYGSATKSHWIKNYFLRKLSLKFWVNSGFWGVGKGGRWMCSNFPKKFEIFSVKYMMIRKREIDFVNLKIKNVTKGLYKNNSEIILSSPVEYLRKYFFLSNLLFFTTSFIYIYIIL